MAESAPVHPRYRWTATGIFREWPPPPPEESKETKGASPPLNFADSVL